MALWRKFVGTEMQHDFGKYGITKSRINDSPYFNDSDILKESVNSQDPIEALTDAKLCEAIFGGSLSNPTGSVQMDRGRYRRWERRNDKKVKQIWEIRTVGIDQLRGEALATALGIPNNSVAVVDTDNGIIQKRMKQGPPSTYTMYYCINNVTRADSAGKANTHTTKGRQLFSGLKGIICKAIVSDQDILIQGDNQLNMKYNINNTYEKHGDGGSDGMVTQTWVPKSEDLELFVIEDPNKQNNITTIEPIVKKLIVREELRAPEENEVQAFLRKRGGDQFTGWISQNLLQRLTEPFEVIYWVSTGGRPFVSNIPDINIQAESAGGRLGDIFTSTGDFPYACFCIECLGISVLFREQNQIIYIRRVYL
jgi:hypothetical protein